MNNTSISARLDVLVVALQEVCRALAPAQAAQVAAGLRERDGGADLNQDADEAAAGELARLLEALGHLRGGISG